MRFGYMRKLLEEAIEQLRDLPEDEQNVVAEVVFTYVSSDERDYRLRPDQRGATKPARPMKRDNPASDRVV